MKKYNIIANWSNYLVLAMFAFFFFSYSVISILSHWHFETWGWDLGFFDQIIWKASQGDWIAYSTIAKENLMADHFQAVLYLLIFVYRFFGIEGVLVSQAFFVCLAALPLYITAKAISKNVFFSIAVTFSYLLFTGTQWLILNEFHQTYLLPLFLALFFYGIVLHKNYIFWLSVLGILATKEEFSLLISVLGIMVFFQYKMKREGLILFLGGIVSFFLLIYLIMPWFSVNKVYSHFDFGDSGYTPVDVVKNSLANPFFILQKLYTPEIKINTVIETISSFAYFPVISFWQMLPVAENFFTRFIYAGPQFTKWVNVNQHAAPLGILMSMASVYAPISIYGFFKKRKITISQQKIFLLAGILLVTASLYQNFKKHGPINSIFKPNLYRYQGFMMDNYQMLKLVPKDSTVAVSAQNSLAAHVSGRKKIYLLPELNDATYVLMDLKDGPNKFSPLDQKGMIDLRDRLIASGNFEVLFKQNDAILLRRIKMVLQ
jgi:uncharacterized membrane protein